MTVCDDLELVAKYLDTLENITKEELIETAKQYLDINKATISILKPKKDN